MEMLSKMKVEHTLEGVAAADDGGEHNGGEHNTMNEAQGAAAPPVTKKRKMMMIFSLALVVQEIQPLQNLQKPLDHRVTVLP